MQCFFSPLIFKRKNFAYIIAFVKENFVLVNLQEWVFDYNSVQAFIRYSLQENIKFNTT